MPTDNPRITFALTDEMRTRITDYQFANHCKNQSQAILELIRRGIGDLEDNGEIVQKREPDFIEKFAQLDKYGRQAVQSVIDIEYRRCQDEAHKDRLRPVLHLVKMPVYDDPAAAGEPLSAESGYEYVEFKAEDVPGGAEFGVRISGESMGETVPDGCVAFVRRSERAGDGDVVIATLRGEGTVCKRIIADGDRLLRLHSDNTDYPDIEGDRLDDLKIHGVVLGHTKL